MVWSWHDRISVNMCDWCDQIIWRSIDTGTDWCDYAIWGQRSIDTGTDWCDYAIWSQRSTETGTDWCDYAIWSQRSIDTGTDWCDYAIWSQRSTETGTDYIPWQFISLCHEGSLDYHVQEESQASDRSDIVYGICYSQYWSIFHMIATWKRITTGGDLSAVLCSLSCFFLYFLIKCNKPWYLFITSVSRTSWNDLYPNSHRSLFWYL
jgi:hypothetical protein